MTRSVRSLKPLKLNKVVKTTVNETEQLDLIASRIPTAVVPIPQRCMLEMCACNVEEKMSQATGTDLGFDP